MQTKGPAPNNPSSLSDAVNGGCQCGSVRYQVTGQPLTLYVCHCKDCQKQSSSAFGMSLWISPDEFKLVTGNLSFYVTRGDSGATKRCSYCNLCGSRIFHTTGQPGAILSLKAGSLDDTSRLEPVAHIWTRSAQPWVVVDRQLYPCFETEPPNDQILTELWRQTRLR